MIAVAPGRAKGMAIAFAVVLLVIAAFSLVARITAGGIARAMTEGDSTMEAGQDVLVGRRLAGVIARLQRAELAGVDLGIILGASAAGYDIDPPMLSELSGSGLAKRWLTLSAKGANGSDLGYLAELLVAAKLPVKELILAINPTVLAQSDNYLSDPLVVDPKPFLRELRAGHLTSSKLELAALIQRPLNRAFPQRLRIGHHARVLAAGVKARMFSAIGLGPEALYAADPDPWVSEAAGVVRGPESPPAPVSGTAARETQEGPVRKSPLGDVADKGWADASAYRATSANARALGAIIRKFREDGITVLVVILPEMTSARQSLPPEAMNCLAETLKLAGGRELPQVLDFRDSVDDAEFQDALHLSVKGREHFTRILGEALRERTKAAR